MSLVSKQRLLKEIESVLAERVPSSVAGSTINEIAVALSNYEIEMIPSSYQDSDTEDFVEAFLSAKIVEGRSPKTVNRYRYAIGKLFAYSSVPIRSVSVFHLRSFFVAEKNRGISDSTIEGFREIYSSFFGWLHKEGLLLQNPCANLAPIKCVKKVRTPYSGADVERIKEVCTSDRDRALVAFLMSTGCRISEVCALNREDVDLAKRECTVLGKGNKERVVFIDDVTAMLI